MTLKIRLGYSFCRRTSRVTSRRQVFLRRLLKIQKNKIEGRRNREKAETEEMHKNKLSSFSGLRRAPSGYSSFPHYIHLYLIVYTLTDKCSRRRFLEPPPRIESRRSEGRLPDFVLKRRGWGHPLYLPERLYY